MKTNTFVAFISRSSAVRSIHHASCSQQPVVNLMMFTFTERPPIFMSLATLNAQRQSRYYVSARSNDNNDRDEVEQNGMAEAFSYLETLTTEDWDSNSVENEQIDYSSVLKHSRTDETPASNFGKSTEEEVQHYLEMQQQLERTAPVDQDDDVKRSVEAEVSLESSGVDAKFQDIDEFPWTSINPIFRLRGPVATGYGRGGKKLGVPTANLPASLFQSALDEIRNGVYFGWAVIEQPASSSTTSAENVTSKGRNVPIKAVVNVGYSPTFEGRENKEKIVEAHLITKSSPMTIPEWDAYDGSSDVDNATNEIEGDFYGETMRLQLIGYLRPEKKFDSFPELIAQIHCDIGNASRALDSMPFIFSKEDEFIKFGSSQWIGSGGGDCYASWENEVW